MKQTAVEWLWDMLLKGEFINNPEELFEQAKEMEKEQIMKARQDGFNRCFRKGDRKEVTNEQYYNETYEKNI